MMAGLLPLLIGVAVLLLLSGFFSGSETALMSLSRTEVKRMSTGTRQERTAFNLLKKPQRLLSTVLVGNMFVNVLLASLFATLLDRLLDPVPGEPGLFERLAHFCFPEMGVAGVERFGNIGRSLLNILLVTPMLMIFGEQTPKVVAYAKGPQIARAAARPLALLCVVLTPINWLLHVCGNFVLNMLGQQKVGGWDEMTTSELLATISAGQETGATNGSEHNILERVVELGTIDVKEVMTHRMDVVGIEDSMTLREAFDFARHQRHSWYPVYSEDLDDTWAMFALVDYPRWRGRPEMETKLSEYRERICQGNTNDPLPLYKPGFTPESARIDTLLHNMRQQARSFAIVVDEHGGTAGIVTLNDLIEELLGRFASGAEDEDDITLRNDGIALADGRAHLRQLQKRFGHSFDNEDGDADTIGGLIMERLGHIPKKGEELRLEDGTLLRVKRVSEHRVRTVVIVPPDYRGEASAVTTSGGGGNAS